MFICVAIIICTAGCREPESNIEHDLARKVSGTYYGEYHYSGAGVNEAFVQLSRLNDSTLTLAATISGELRYRYNVKMTEEIDGTVSLSFHRFNESLTGVIDGIELTYNHNYNYFIGSKSVL